MQNSLLTSSDPVYRVNWIRSISIRDRWKEELCIVESEMEWFVRFTESRKNRALEWTNTAATDGHMAYAYHQSHMWKLLSVKATKDFEAAGVRISLD
jgi:hypothetical protein